MTLDPASSIDERDATRGDGTLSPVMRLIGESFLIWQRHRLSQLVPHGVTLKQLYVLGALGREPKLSPSRIAEMLFCDRPTATVVLKNMERRGWIQRDRHPVDRRKVLVRSTRAGKAKLNEVIKAGVFSSGGFDPLSCFSPAELARLEKSLRTLRRHLEALQAESPT